VFRSLKTKFLAVQFGVVLLVGLSLGASAYVLITRAVERSQGEHLRYLADTTAQDLAQAIEDKRQALQDIARGEAVANYALTHKATSLREYFSPFVEAFSALVFVNEDGREEVKVPHGEGGDELRDISGSGLLQDAALAPNRTVLSFSASPAEPDRARLEFAFYRESFFGEFQGVVVGRVLLADLLQPLADARVGETGFFAVLDRDGRILSHPKKGRLLNTVSVRGARAEEILSQATASRERFVRAAIEGVDGYIAYAPVEGLGWIVLVTMPREEFLAAPTAVRNTAIWISLGVLTVAALLSLRIASGVAKPIMELTSAAVSFAESGSSPPLRTTSRDEVGTLGESFNRMMVQRTRAEEALRRARDELELRVEERTAELTALNQELMREVQERKRTETALRESDAELRLVSNRLLTAQETERARMARELHDSIGQTLSALMFFAENALHEAGEGSGRPGLATLRAVIPKLKDAVDEVRSIAMAMRPSTLDDLGLLPTLGWLCREFQTSHPGIHVQNRAEVKEAEIPETLKIVIYRVTQEALNNAARHSQADRVLVALLKDESRLELTVEDNGQGFDLEPVLSATQPERGVGLSNMKERVQLSGGSFSVTSEGESGTVIRASWSLEYWQGQVAPTIPLQGRK
jgi:signal transduction histidine kinase